MKEAMKNEEVLVVEPIIVKAKPKRKRKHAAKYNAVIDPVATEPETQEEPALKVTVSIKQSFITKIKTYLVERVKTLVTKFTSKFKK